jgi:hypothetical protein
LVGVTLFVLTVGARNPSVGAAGATTTKLTAKTVSATDLAAAVRAAALLPAQQVGAVLGVASCPTGVSTVVGTVAQCIVGFDKTPVPFLVRVDSGGVLAASPTFLVLSRVGIDAAATAVAGPTVRCGTERVLVVPAASEITCAGGKATLTFRVGAQGQLTRTDASPRTTATRKR